MKTLVILYIDGRNAYLLLNPNLVTHCPSPLPLLNEGGFDHVVKR